MKKLSLKIFYLNALRLSSTLNVTSLHAPLQTATKTNAHKIKNITNMT